MARTLSLNGGVEGVLIGLDLTSAETRRFARTARGLTVLPWELGRLKRSCEIRCAGVSLMSEFRLSKAFFPKLKNEKKYC